MKVSIRHISLVSLGRFGCVLGIVVAFLPGLACGLVGLGSAHLARNWLENWQDLTITLLGQEVVRVDLVQLLGLGRLLETLWIVDAASVSLATLVVLGLALILGVLLAAVVMLGGLTFNLLSRATGGLVVDIVAAPGQDAGEPDSDPPPAKG
jgi:hypothetical protein